MGFVIALKLGSLCESKRETHWMEGALLKKFYCNSYSMLKGKFQKLIFFFFFLTGHCYAAVLLCEENIPWDVSRYVCASNTIHYRKSSTRGLFKVSIVVVVSQARPLLCNLVMFLV